MENQPKLNSSKEVIAFLAERFPHCFSAEGEARPLKIGIFRVWSIVLCRRNEPGAKRNYDPLYVSTLRAGVIFTVLNPAQRVSILTATHAVSWTSNM